MDTQTTILILMAAALLLVALARGGDLWKAGLLAGGRGFWRLLPILLVSYAIAGLLEVLLPREVLTHWLGSSAGWRGILIGCGVGALMPGPPYAIYPLVISLYRSGAGIGAIVGLLTGKVLWNVYYLPPAFAVLGPQVTAAQFLSTLIFPPLAGWIATQLMPRFM